jgi:hypothetical protein
VIDVGWNDGSDCGWACARPNSAIDQSGGRGDDQNEGRSESNCLKSYVTWSVSMIMDENISRRFREIRLREINNPHTHKLTREVENKIHVL